MSQIIIPISPDEFDHSLATEFKLDADHTTIYTYIDGGAYFVKVKDYDIEDYDLFHEFKIISHPKNYFDFVRELRGSTSHGIIQKYIGGKSD